MSERRDSNPRPPAWKASALSTELLSRVVPHLFYGAPDKFLICGESGGIGRFNERKALSLRDSIAERVGADGFEPPKSKTADLQSAPFGHSGTHPVFKEL